MQKCPFCNTELVQDGEYLKCEQHVFPMIGSNDPMWTAFKDVFDKELALTKVIADLDAEYLTFRSDFHRLKKDCEDAEKEFMASENPAILERRRLADEGKLLIEEMDKFYDDLPLDKTEWSEAQLAEYNAFFDKSTALKEKLEAADVKVAKEYEKFNVHLKPYSELKARAEQIFETIKATGAQRHLLRRSYWDLIHTLMGTPYEV